MPVLTADPVLERASTAPGEHAPGWFPGLALAIAVAIAARFFARFTGPIPDVILALVIGIAIRNVLRPSGIQPGVKFTLFYLLRAAIILLGAGLSVQAVIRTGSATLALVITLVTTAVLLGLLFARVFSLRGKIGTLIGAGTAICGGSAILTIGPVIGAADEEIAYAITTIFTFNIAALIVYPALGHALGMTQTAFGSWTGTAVNDTSVVVATGYIFGPMAGAVATVVKLTRTVLLVPVAVIAGSAYAAGAAKGKSTSGVWHRAIQATPLFVVGFAAMAALNSMGLFSASALHVIALTASFLIVIVLSGVGLNVDLARIAGLGIRPLLVGMLLAAVMAICSFGLIALLQIQ